MDYYLHLMLLGENPLPIVWKIFSKFKNLILECKPTREKKGELN